MYYRCTQLSYLGGSKSRLLEWHSSGSSVSFIPLLVGRLAPMPPPLRAAKFEIERWEPKDIYLDKKHKKHLNKSTNHLTK